MVLKGKGFVSEPHFRMCKASPLQRASEGLGGDTAGTRC